MPEDLASIGRPEPEPARLVGSPILRQEDARLLRGQGRYVDDLRLPGLLHAAFLRSPHPHAHLRGVDAAAAWRLPTVWTAVHAGAVDFAAVGPIQPRIATAGVVCPARPVLARDVVRFVGEPVAVVVAGSREEAEDALAGVEASYEPLPPVTDVEAALADGAPRLHADVPGNRFADYCLDVGAVDRAFAEAEVLLDWRRFETPRVCGVPIEPRGVVAAPVEGGRVTVWSSTQVPHRVREVIARSLGLPEAAVRVIVPDVGGGFGTKAQVYPEEVVVAWLALRLGQPVKWVETRREHLLAAGHARQQVIEARLAATSDGVVTAIDARLRCDVGAYGIYPFGPAFEAQGTSAMLPGPYRFGHYRCRVQAVATNKSPNGPYRGVGMPVSTLVHERLMDLLAHEIGVEPIEVRRRNLVPAAALPYTSVTGLEYDSGDYAACLERAAATLDLSAWRQRQQETRAGGGPHRLGIGMACYVEYTGVGPQLYQQRGLLDVPGFDSARVRLTPDGRLTLTTSLVDIGQGLQTTFAQLVADELGLPLTAIRVDNADTGVAPPGTGTFASRSAAVGAGAVLAACQRLRDRLLAAAAEELEAAPGDLELCDGRIRVRGTSDRSISFGELASRHGDGLTVHATYQGPPATFAYATHAAVVEVDTCTGQVALKAYVVAEDCGRVINSLIADGQIRGAVAQGLANALLEQLRYDDSGQLVTASLMDYALPTAVDLPNLDVVHQHTPAPGVPGGAKGVGEGGTIAAPAVVANALSDALGVEVYTLPLTAERVLALWRQGDGGRASPSPAGWDLALQRLAECVRSSPVYPPEAEASDHLVAEDGGPGDRCR